MTGSKIIDVAIGLSFTYFLLSLFCSALNELVAGLLGLRQTTLVAGVERMLGNSETLRKEVYEHPLLKSLHNGWFEWTKRPSYIPSQVFASALKDVLAGKTELVAKVKLEAEERARKNRKPMAEGVLEEIGLQVEQEIDHVQRCVGALAQGTKTGDAAAYELRAIGRWFDDAMDRVSGAYKRTNQVWLVGIAMTIALALNVDTITVARTLWLDSDLRKSVADAASTYAAKEVGKAAAANNRDTASTGKTATDQGFDRASATSAAAFTKAIDSANEKLASATASLDAVRLPMGWRDGFWSLGHSETDLGKVLGLALTALAISLGAPFWFDALGRVANVRSAGAKPKTAAAAKN